MKVFTEIIQKKPECKSAILSGVGRLHLQVGFVFIIFIFLILKIVMFYFTLLAQREAFVFHVSSRDYSGTTRYNTERHDMTRNDST